MAGHSISVFEATFGQVKIHQQVGDIIRRFSTNRDNIYQLALSNTNVQEPTNILDIGCGYGRFTGYLDQVVKMPATCTGIDIVENNRKPYLQVARKAGLTGQFICGPATIVNSFPDRSYQLIIAGYSLNFFYNIIPHLPRILDKNGWFITINHSKQFLAELIEDIKSAWRKSFQDQYEEVDFQQLVASFNAENGYELLESHFDVIEKIDYKNKLNFTYVNIDQCLIYTDFKLPMMMPHKLSEKDEEYVLFKHNLHQIIKYKVKVRKIYTLNKDDCIFRCRCPK